MILLHETVSRGSLEDGDFIREQYLWNNFYIRSKEMPLYDENLCSRGIKRVNDLVTVDGYMKTWETISREFNLGPLHFLKWFGLLQAIPNNWKNCIKNVCSSGIQKISGIFIDGNFLDMKSISTKKIYDAMVGKKFVKPRSQQYFHNILKTARIDWKKVYLLPRLVSIDTKTRIFQYKILNNILYLNKRLFQMKIVPSPLCSLCEKTEETVTHLFSECEFSRKLWDEIRVKCKDSLVLPNLSAWNVCLGIFEQSSDLILENHILVLFKRFIYEKKINRTSINIYAFWKYLMKIKDIELRVAVKNENLATMLIVKWAPLD